MAQRMDAPGEAEADRVDDAQQIDGQRRLVLDAFFDAGGVGVARGEVDDLDQAGLRRGEATAADRLGAREVVALEKLEAERRTAFEVGRGVDAEGE